MKKTSKKMIALVMSLILLIGILPITALAATTVDSGSFSGGLKWSVNSDGVLTISGKGAISDFEEDMPPWFGYFEDITSIVIGDGITKIGDYAFALLYNASKLTIPSSVTEIGVCAFTYCESLTSVTIPNGVVTIGEGAFSMCTSLTKVTIPKSVTTIEPGAFLECYSLEQITVDSNNKAYSTDSKGVLFNKAKTAIVCTPANLTGSYAIPKTVVEIPSYAFTNSLYLEGLSIPASATMIEVCAFLGCVSLTEVTVDKANPDFTADERGVLFNKEKTALYCAPAGIADSYTVPNGVIVIYPFAFTLCLNLKEAIIPNTVTDIGEGAFTTSGLTKITIPASVAYIGDGAFRDCADLSVVKFEGDAPEVGEEVPVFEETELTVYYPEGNSTWTNPVRTSFGGNATWTPYIPEAMITKGDVNGDLAITNADLIMMARYIVGLIDAESEEAENIANIGDMDADGKVTNADLIALARVIVGIA